MPNIRHYTLPMTRRPFPIWRTAIAAFAVLVIAAAVVWWGDVVRTTLDPKIPFQTYTPPPAPNYAKAGSWALRPTKPTQAVDVFFIAPTTYAGGKHWNAPIDDAAVQARMDRAVLPNGVGPFAAYANLYAPLYRHASLYAMLSGREDARDARVFAYGDVAAAFRHYLKHDNGGRPFILVGIEQGGLHLQRLLRDELGDPMLRALLVAAYALDTPVPLDTALTPCASPLTAGCLVSYTAVTPAEIENARKTLEKSYVWGSGDQLIALGGRDVVCTNPLNWAMTTDRIEAKWHRGGVNATGLEISANPPPLPHEVSAQCAGGLLMIDEPEAPSLRRSGSWIEQHMAPPYNLFYADLAADGARRFANWRDSDAAKPAPPITVRLFVRAAPIHTVD
jgi:hypothetical protein